MECLNEIWRSVNLYFSKHKTSKIGGNGKILKKAHILLVAVQTEKKKLCIISFQRNASKGMLMTVHKNCLYTYMHANIQYILLSQKIQENFCREINR